jgi:hypothetical protein
MQRMMFGWTPTTNSLKVTRENMGSSQGCACRTAHALCMSGRRRLERWLGREGELAFALAAFMEAA